MRDNLLKMIEILESKRIVTKKFLAEELNVHPRTIHRYKKTLIDLGYNIMVKYGYKGGYLMIKEEL